MTKEEAKLVLDNARPQTKEIDRQFYDDEDLNNALDMAIKALEQQPSEDCVSRQAVRDAIMKCETINEDSADGFIKSTTELEAEIACLPPVTPTQSWIPVSERLPKESGNYLIYGKVVDYEENCVFIGEYDSDYEKFGYKEDIYDSETLGFLDSEFCEYDKVIAWQPLPKPYEEKRGNENGKK